MSFEKKTATCASETDLSSGHICHLKTQRHLSQRPLMRGTFHPSKIEPRRDQHNNAEDDECEDQRYRYNRIPWLYACDQIPKNSIPRMPMANATRTATTTPPTALSIR